MCKTWNKALNSYDWTVDLRIFRDARSYQGYFNREIRSQDVVKFENEFRQAVNSVGPFQIAGEVCFWKNFGNHLARNKVTKALLHHLAKPEDSRAFFRAVQKTTKVPSYANFLALRQSCDQERGFATPITFLAFYDPDNYPMVDKHIANWWHSRRGFFGFAEAPSFRQRKKDGWIMSISNSDSERNWKAYLKWREFCCSYATKLSELCGRRWRARDVEMAVWEAQKRDIDLPEPISMGDFEKSAWTAEAFSQNYLEKADMYIVDRRKMIGIVSALYRYFYPERKYVRTLDLGCGDGILTQELFLADKTIVPTLVDGSQSMLEKARIRLSEIPNARYLEASFQKILEDVVELGEFDLAVSSLAIHHLELKEKIALFKYIYEHLSTGGNFINIDVVLPPSEVIEGWYFDLWKRWMKQMSEQLGIKDETPEDLIRRYKSPSSMNKPDTLEAQLNGLKRAGFLDADCYYKHGIFAVFGGRK